MFAPVVLLVCQTLAQSSDQTGLLGPREVIRELGAKDPNADMVAKENALIRDLQVFAAIKSTLPSGEAAARWLQLVDEAHAIPHRPTHNGGNPSPIGMVSTVFMAIPGPAAWPDIEARVAEMPPSSQRSTFRLLFARLRGDDDTVIRLCEEGITKAMTADTNTREHYAGGQYAQVELAALKRKGNLEAQLKFLHRPLAIEDAQFPDLASLLVPAQAKAQMLLFLKEGRQGLYIRSRPTLLLAQQVASANLGGIKQPPWDMVRDMRDAPFARKLVAHYGIEAAIKDQGQQGFTSVYFADLLERGDVSGAATLIKRLNEVPNLPSSSYLRNDSALVAAKCFKSVEALISRSPNKDLWSTYVESANASGHARQALAMLTSTIKDPNTKPAIRKALMPLLVEQNLHLGDVPGFLQAYRDYESVPRTSDDYDVESEKLFGVGSALGDADLMDKGLIDISRGKRNNDSSLVWDLLARGALSRAEALILKSVKAISSQPNPYYYDDYVYELTRIYYRAGRPGDILTLVRSYPYWMDHELASVIARSNSGPPSDAEYAHPPFGFFIAWAFEKTGQHDLAIEILRRTLFKVRYCDEAYELLNSIAGQKAISFYDDLCEAAPLEVRPLAWRADLLRHLGRLKEADAAARQAIKLDPTDGGATDGHRFKAFAILSAIQRAEGDAKGAAESERRVTAGKLAEKAQACVRVGLLPQAVQNYQRAIQTSPTDYLTEEGLARCLDRQGKSDSGAAHHIHAFRLLAQEFGAATELQNDYRAMFDDPDLISFGEQAMLKPQASTNRSAPACYVRGLVEDAMGRPLDAIADFKRSSQIDDTFMPAWIELSELGSQGYLSPLERESINIKCAEINPWHRGYPSYEFEDVSELGAVYRLIEKHDARVKLPGNGPLLPLHAYTPYWEVLPDLQWNSYPSPSLDAPVGARLTRAADLAVILSLFNDGL